LAKNVKQIGKRMIGRQKTEEGDQRSKATKDGGCRFLRKFIPLFLTYKMETVKEDPTLHLRISGGLPGWEQESFFALKGTPYGKQPKRFGK
jgi:hypothetical protein